MVFEWFLGIAFCWFPKSIISKDYLSGMSKLSFDSDRVLLFELDLFNPQSHFLKSNPLLNPWYIFLRDHAKPYNNLSFWMFPRNYVLMITKILFSKSDFSEMSRTSFHSDPVLFLVLLKWFRRFLKLGNVLKDSLQRFWKPSCNPSKIFVGK